MSNFVPRNYDLRTALIFCYHLKKTAAESHRMLVEAYGEHALGKSQCFEWFKKFKSGDFDVRNEERGRPSKKFDELLKPGKTVNTERYRQQMIDLNQALREKRPEYQKRQHKVILLHDNAPSHTAKPVKETIEAFSWEILSHAAYSPDLAPSDYYLFASMGHAFAEQHFTSYENVRKWLDDWVASKEQQFFWRGIHKLSERWEKCIASNGQYFE
ncbi:Mariner Mos1 transposase [Formica fusca]